MTSPSPSPATAPTTTTAWVRATDARGTAISLRRVRSTVWSYNAADGSDGTTPATVARDHTEVATLWRGQLVISTEETARCVALGWYTTVRGDDGRPVREDATRCAALACARPHPNQVAWMPADGVV